MECCSQTPIRSVIEMMQQSITTQNKRIDKQDATLQQIISQQQTTKANMEKLSNIMYTIGQKLALLLPISSTEASPPPDPVLTSDPSPPSAYEPDSQPSKLFDGKPKRCRGFILQCRLAFGHAPRTYVLDASLIL